MHKESFHAIDTVFTVILFGVFTACVLLVLTLGTRAYSASSRSAGEAYAERTGLSYVSEKLRQGDRPGAVYTGSFDGLDALYIDSYAGGTVYSDILYCFDGWLCELYCEKGAEFFKTDGIRIIEARSVDFSQMESGLIRVTLTGSGQTVRTLYVHTRSGGRL